MPQDDFDDAVVAYQRALDSFVHGDPTAVKERFSRRDDVTLANPLGPPRLGRAAVEQAIGEASAHFTSGSLHFEEISRYVSGDLGYVVWLEKGDVQLVGTEEMRPTSLRVTMIFRREGDTWTVAHRHADPITTAQPISTVLDDPPTT